MTKMITSLGVLGATLLAMACTSEDPTGVGTGQTTGTTGTTTGSTTSTTDTTATTETTTGGGTEEEIIDSANPAWVHDNTKMIQGSFFVLMDSVKDDMPVTDTLPHTVLMPSTFADATSLCVNGTIPGVVTEAGTACKSDGSDCAWSAMWGGGMGLNLNESGDTVDADGNVTMESVQGTFDATAAGVTGFSFTLAGSFDGEIRFKATMEGALPDDDFCLTADIGGNDVNKYNLSDLKYKCWDKSLASQKTLDLTKLVQIQWQLVSKAGTEYAVTDFCLSKLSVF